MRDFRVVAFDCDGVLFNTERANRIYYNRLLERVGRPAMTPDQFAYIHMHAVEESLAYLFEDERELREIRIYRETLDYQPFLKYMEMEPDLLPLLRFLRPEWKTAIATNRSDTIAPLLEEYGIREHFDLVVGALDVRRPKPDPEALLKILAHFDVAPHQMIYVGDSVVDEKAARAANIPLAAYGTPSLSADFHIHRLKEIRTILTA
ncbi:MAG: HAD family hydrolase [Desulfobacterales bacterium]|nr:HAD family hydrolase [Desulfobacterales bacterium]